MREKKNPIIIATQTSSLFAITCNVDMCSYTSFGQQANLILCIVCTKNFRAIKNIII